MKYTTIHLEGNTIEIHNSILGKETIRVNGEIVSQHYSFFGAKHLFNITENGNEVACKINIKLSMNGVVFDFYKDDKPAIVAAKNKTFVVGIFIGIVFGIMFYNFLKGLA